MEPEGLPIDDPFERLPETAKRILAAAGRIVARDGARALTLSAVERESGENRALVAYHFGNKHGLVAALVDATFHAASLSVAERLRTLPSGTERVRMTGVDLALLSTNHEAFKVFYQLLPLAFDDEDLSRKVASVYEWYRALFARVLNDSGFGLDAPSHPYGALVAAVVDGLAIQQTLGGEEFDLEAAIQAWAGLLSARAELLQLRAASNGTHSP